MNPIIHLDSDSGSSGSGLNFKYSATNYADLLTRVGMVEGDLAYVYNSQGVWLINRKPSGVYQYQLGVWEYGSQDLQDQIENLLVNEFKVKIDAADTTGKYLFDALVGGPDIFSELIDISGNKTQVLSLQDSAKVYVSLFDPTVNDDSSVLYRHRVGQIWHNEATCENFIACSLVAGSAVWIPIPEVESLKTKSGITLNAAFSGNPKIATVTFSTAFADANYSVSLVCNSVGGNAYTPVVENILAGSFDINMTVNNINNLTDIRWIAVKNGEN